MPIERKTISEVVETVRHNREREWPTRIADNRVEPICLPALRPSFELVPGEAIFTIGSCFARNIEKALTQHGFDVIPRRLLECPLIDNVGIANHYSPVAIRQAFEWALEPGRRAPPSASFFELRPGAFLDPHLHVSEARPRAEVDEISRAVIENVAAVKEARVVIITLGLVEVWLDKATGNYLNRAPVAHLARRHANDARFEFQVLSYEDNLQTLEEIHALLARHLRPDFKILLTVSPVTLGSTVRDVDVITANCYSKSVLRAVAEAFVTAHDNVDYFPSYESVTISDRTIAYEPDFKHVTEFVVSLNVRRMLAAYVKGTDWPAIELTRELADFRASYAERFPPELKRLALSLRDAAPAWIAEEQKLHLRIRELERALEESRAALMADGAREAADRLSAG